MDHEPRIRLQRHHRSLLLRSDRPLRDHRPRRYVPRAADRTPARAGARGAVGRGTLRARLRSADGLRRGEMGGGRGVSAFTSRLAPPQRKPEWIRIKIRTGESFQKVREMVSDLKLHTV